MVGEAFEAWDGDIQGKNIELDPPKRILQLWRTSEFEDDDKIQKMKWRDDMKKILRMALVLSLIFMLGIPTTTALFAQAEIVKPLLGTWDVELTDMGMVMQFIFKMEDDTLTGILEFEMGSGIMEEITFNENKLTFLVSLDANGQMIDIEGIATIEGEEMTGTMITEMGEASFTGKKSKISDSIF